MKETITWLFTPKYNRTDVLWIMMAGITIPTKHYWLGLAFILVGSAISVLVENLYLKLNDPQNINK